MTSLPGSAHTPFPSSRLPVRLRFLLALPCLLVMPACGSEGDTGSAGNDGRFATAELEAAYPEPFGYLSGVRELEDGRILAADPASQVLLRLDLDAGTADTLGRQGAGPQEYEGPDRVFPLPGDTTLLVDLGNGRLTVIDPEGTFVEWIPMYRRTGDGQDRLVHPRFVDVAGSLYTTEPYGAQGGSPDSTAIHRLDRVDPTETPVAATWHTDYATLRGASRRPMFVLSDDWAVGPDGRVAVVRGNGYSVDWYLPGGRQVQGPPNEAEVYPLGEPEMHAEVDYMSSEAIFSQMMVGDGGVESRQMARGVPPGSMPSIDDFAWPETLPIFRFGGTRVSPGGEAWVERIMPAGQPARVEVFDERGIRAGFIELPPRSKVIGFGGAGAAAGEIAYVARTDEVGLVWLERYRIHRSGE